MYRNDGGVRLDFKIVFKFGFEKGVFLTKSMVTYGKELLHFYQETSSLIGNQTNHRTNMFCLINPTRAMSRTICAFVL